MTETYPLEKEIATYVRARASLAHEEGRFVVIAEDCILGVFDTYHDALTAGYKTYKLSPFLVKQISSVEAVANFSRHLKIA